MKCSLLSMVAVLLLGVVQQAHAQEAPVNYPESVPTPAPGVLGPSATPPMPPPDAPPQDATLPQEPIDPAALNAMPAEAEAPQMSEEELKALGFGTTEAEAIDTSLHFFGFADFTVAVNPVKKSAPWRQAFGRHANFAVGNLNMFFSKAFSQNVRTMGEVRFLFAPHGSKGSDGNVLENVTYDPADNDRAQHWGGIEIERLYLEWQLHPQLALRTGMFLSPYGIWNVDHGSPLFIPVQRPYVIGSALIPEHQTGFEFLGSWNATSNGTLGYHFTLSNGSGPVAEVRDLDDNKAVGARVYWDDRHVGQLRFGFSMYYGMDTSATYTQGLSPMSKLTVTEKVSNQSKMLSMAGDVQFKYKGLHLQAEVITQQRKFMEASRFSAVNGLTGRPMAPIDTISWGVYGLAGYRFQFLGIMPYFMVQAFDLPSGANAVATEMTGYTLGLNSQPLPGIVAKLEYAMVQFPSDYIISGDLLHVLQLQVAWAF